MHVPKVTLGVPVYNGAVYLAETLDTLLGQEFTDFELIISDNASTDATPEICAAYAAKDPRIRYVRAESNQGAAKNYNTLVDLARAPYFKWASADDLCAPQLLARCVEVLDNHADVVVAYPQTVLIDATGARLGDFADQMHMPHAEPWARLRHFAGFRRRCNPCFGLIRLDALRRTGLVRPNVHSDITLLAELAIAGAFHEVPERLFFRRVTKTSCGFGELTLDQVAAWFDPKHRGSWIPPRAVVFLQILRAIAAAPLPAAVRLRCLATFIPTWTKRWAGVTLWKYRRRFAAKRTTPGAGGPTSVVSNGAQS